MAAWGTETKRLVPLLDCRHLVQAGSLREALEPVLAGDASESRGADRFSTRSIENLICLSYHLTD